MILYTGCSTFIVSDDTVTTTVTEKFGVTTTETVEHEVDVWRGNVFMNASVEKAGIEYGNVKVNVGNFQQAGDYKSIEATGNAIVNGIVAWMTYGTAPAVKGAVMATLLPAQPGASTNTPAIK
jgi:hypothetical protein